MLTHAVLHCFTFSLILSVAAGRGESEAKVDSAIEFKPGIAEVVAQSKAGLAEATERFARGLPKSTTFHVAFRLVDVFERPELAWIRVSAFDREKSTIQGRISNDVHPWTGWSRGEQISCQISDIIGWKILHADGSVEGNDLGKFVDAQAAGTTMFDLLEDKRKADLASFSRSAPVGAAMDGLYLRIFREYSVQIEHVKSLTADIEEWPGLASRLRDVPRKELVASIKAKAEELKASAGVIVEDTEFFGKKQVTITGSIIIKRGDAAYLVKQYLHLYYDEKEKLKIVSWGLRSIKTLHLEPAAASK